LIGMMSTLTGLLYGALVVYLGGWFLGHWIGNFALLLLMLTLVTLAYWLAERFMFKPARDAAATRLEAEHAVRRTELGKGLSASTAISSKRAKNC
jgi:signal peptidase I